MGPSNDESHATTTAAASAMDGRRSYEAGPPSAGKLRKHASNRGLRAVSHNQPFALTSAPQNLSSRANVTEGGGFGDGTKARKGSIRNAVRKIFGGRRSRDSVSQLPSTTDESPMAQPSRHTYHKSEPVVLPPQPEVPEPVPVQDLVQRSLSGSQQAPPPSVSRTGSPYAVQFPNSVRLKPMDLGNPFIAGPSQLRRRKTLPSMVVEGDGASPEPQATRDVPDLPVGFEDTRSPPPIPKRVPSSSKQAKRRSRSADDLNNAAAGELPTSRKKSDEIRYWRESFQADVLRASGFVSKVSERDSALERPATSSSRKSVKDWATQEQGLDKTQIPILASSAISREGTVKSTPPRQAQTSLSVEDPDYRPSSGGGTDLSKDLEDRVARLEAGLQDFQRSLSKMTADRNRRTVILGGSISGGRSSSDMRSPSLLADTLADALEPSDYEYEYGHTMRSSMSQLAHPAPVEQARAPAPPSPPPAQVQGHVEDPFGPPAESTMMRERSTRRERPASPQQTSYQAMPDNVAATIPGSSMANGGQPQQLQQYTFGSLYQMLADERSARRRLERQLRGLRQEISDLHSQVNTTSNMPSARSSYMLSTGTSTRLQELLRQTESSPPRDSPRSLHHLSGASAGHDPVISRFSGSESDVLTPQDYEELETPVEAYLTPREERSRYEFVDRLRPESGESDMF